MSTLLNFLPFNGKEKLARIAASIQSLLAECGCECDAAVSRIAAADQAGYLVELRCRANLDAAALQAMRVYLAPRVSKAIGERISARRMLICQKPLAAPPVTVGPEEMKRELRRLGIAGGRGVKPAEAASSFFGADYRPARGVDVDELDDATSEFMRLAGAPEPSDATYRMPSARTGAAV